MDFMNNHSAYAEAADATYQCDDEEFGSRLIEHEGTPESAWQSCAKLRAVRSMPLDGFLSASMRLVVVAPHPDDEVLACGALLESHVARGGPCLIVAVTDGEASHGHASNSAAQRLADQRREESMHGLARLGVRENEVMRLGLPDGGLAQHVDEMTLQLITLLEPDDVLVTTWRCDGHPDHESTGNAAAQACAITGSRLVEAPVWMWHWSYPGDRRIPWKRMHGLQVPQQTLARKHQALMAHKSQLLPRDSGDGPVLGANIVERAAREMEYFFL